MQNTRNFLGQTDKRETRIQCAGEKGKKEKQGSQPKLGEISRETQNVTTREEETKRTHYLGRRPANRISNPVLSRRTPPEPSRVARPASGGCLVVGVASPRGWGGRVGRGHGSADEVGGRGDLLSLPPPAAAAAAGAATEPLGGRRRW